MSKTFQKTLDVEQIAKQDPEAVSGDSSIVDLARAHLATDVTRSLYGFTATDIQYGTEIDPEFELTEKDFEGYEEFSPVLKNSINSDQLNSYKQEIDDLRLNEKIKSEHGGFANFATGLAVSPLDTTALAIFPVIGLTGKASVNIFKTAGIKNVATKVLGEKAFKGVGAKVLKSAVGSGAIGGTFGATAVAAKASLGADVGAEDIAIGFAEGAVLGALFGGVAEGLGAVRSNRVKAATKNFYEASEVPLTEKYLPEEYTFINKDELSKDIIANKRLITDKAEGAFGAEMVRADPGTRLDTSASAEARSLRAQLSDTNISYVSKKGELLENIPSVESTVKLNFHEDINSAYEAINEGFSGYEKGGFASKAKKFLTGRNEEYNHFTSEVGKAVRENGVHQDPHVAKTAKIFIEKQNKLTNEAMRFDMYGVKERALKRLAGKIDKVEGEITKTSEKHIAETKVLKEAEKVSQYALDEAKGERLLLEEKVDVKQPTREELISYGKSEAKIRAKIKDFTKEEAKLTSELEKKSLRGGDIEAIEKKIEANKAAREKLGDEFKRVREGKTYKPTSKAVALAHERVGKINEDIKSTKKRIVSLEKLKKTKATEKKLTLENKKLSNLESKGLKEQLKLEEKLPVKEELKTYFSTREQKKILLEEQKKLKSDLKDLTLTDKQRERLTNKVKSNEEAYEKALKEFNEAKQKVDIEKVSKGKYVKYGRAVEAEARATHQKKLATSKLESYTKRKDEMVHRRELKIEQLNDELKRDQGRDFTIEDLVKKEGMDPGYMHAMYDREKIAANEVSFKQALETGFMEAQGLSAENATIAADAVIESLLGEGLTRFTSNIIERGPFKEKTLMIPAKYLDEYMINNIDLVYEKFSKTMHTDTRLMELYGTVDVEKVLAKIDDEFNRIKPTVKSNADIAFLRKDFDQAKTDVRTIWDRLRGTSSIDSMSLTRKSRVFRSATNTLMNVTGARLLGSMLLTATNDIGQAAITIGTKRFLGSAVKLMSHPKAFKNLKKENVWLRALKVVDGTRMTTLAETATNSGPLGMAERTSREISNSLFRMSGIHAWDEQSKLIAGYATAEKILDVIRASLAKKRVSHSDSRFIKQIGVSKKYYKLINDQFKAHGNTDKHGIVSPQINKWDKSAREVFGSAIKKVQDQAIITPGVSTSPIMADNPFLAPLFQFKRFAFAAYQKSLVPAMQKRDFNTFTGTMMILSTGMFKAAINAGIDGRTLDPETAVERAVEQSDVLSFLPDLYGLGSSLLGFDKKNSYSTARFLETLAGPSGGTLMEIEKAKPFQMIKGNTTKAQIRAARRLMPFQNHLILKKLFNMASDAAQEKFGTSGKLAK